VLGKIAFRLTADAVEIDEIARATHVMLASEAVDIITIVLAILLVKRLSDYQLQRRCCRPTQPTNDFPLIPVR
jgi:hypothetical protein